jgi:hypothetical protein
MSWRCNASKTRSATLAAEEDAAAAGTQMDNESLVKLLMGEFTDDEDNDPTPTTAEPVAAEWPDEKHIKSAIFAVENPYLVVPHPKNANHPMCEGCGDFAANTLVVPDPGTVPKWPACKGMFPLTHCTECARKDFLATGTEYVFNAATCGCGATRCSSERTICFSCSKGNNALKDCGTEGCGGERAGLSKFCNPCIAQNSRRSMTCFLCGADTTRDKSRLRDDINKKGFRTCQRTDNMECFVRCNAYKDGVRGERCGMRRYENKHGTFKNLSCGSAGKCNKWKDGFKFLD